MTPTPRLSPIRTLLVLGRVSNLPTVWSNCLAGWWLGGGSESLQRPILALAGVTLLYIGGMFMNDAMDVAFDRANRRERPIPSGAISERAVWRWSYCCLVVGASCLVLIGNNTGLLGVVLLGFIIAYDGLHKLMNWSPVLMGLCRWLVYLVAASTATEGVTGGAMWGGLSLAAYVVGLSFIAREETRRSPVGWWPLVLLGVPIALAVLMNVGSFRQPALVLSLLLLIWIARCLRFAYFATIRDVGATVGGLLAGIPLVDLLAVPDFPQGTVWLFPALFLLSTLLQRRVPPT